MAGNQKLAAGPGLAKDKAPPAQLLPGLVQRPWDLTASLASETTACVR